MIFWLCLGYEEMANATFVEIFACRSGPFGLILPPTYVEMRHIGIIQSEILYDAGQAGDSETNERKIIFDGLELVVIGPFYDHEHYGVLQAIIYKSQWVVSGPIRIGQSFAEARSRLLQYGVDLNISLSFGSEDGHITLSFSDDKISRIEYGCYMG